MVLVQTALEAPASLAAAPAVLVVALAALAAAPAVLVVALAAVLAVVPAALGDKESPAAALAVETPAALGDKGFARIVEGKSLAA